MNPVKFIVQKKPKRNMLASWENWRQSNDVGEIFHMYRDALTSNPNIHFRLLMWIKENQYQVVATNV